MRRERLRRLATNPVVKEGGRPLPYVALEHIESDLGRTSDGFEPEYREEGDAALFRSGDVLFGKLRPYLAKVLHPDYSGCASGELLVIRARPDLHPRYLYYVCLSRPFIDWANASSYGVKMPRTSWEQLSDYETHLPSLGDQRAIADFLDRETGRIDALVEKKQRLIDALRRRRESVVFHGVCGLLEPMVSTHDPGLPWGKRVRMPWPAVKINHVARLGTGHTPSRSRPELWENPTIPWITTGEIQQVRDDIREVITETREQVSETGLANSAAVLHPKGTVVLCRTASAGFSAIMGTEMATSQDFVTWTCSEKLLPRYLLTCLRAMRRDLLGRLAFGSTHKTIYWPDVEALRIPLPPIEHQYEVLKEIDERIGPLDSLRAKLDRQIILLREHRQALITAGVTGQLEITKAA